MYILDLNIYWIEWKKKLGILSHSWFLFKNYEQIKTPGSGVCVNRPIELTVTTRPQHYTDCMPDRIMLLDVFICLLLLKKSNY